jgi:tetratricopeptide (TPR) repeat protein
VANPRVLGVGKVRRAVLVTLLLGASQSSAQSDADVSTAREIAKEGLSAYDAGRYEEASQKLSRALEVVGVPTLALYTARANAKLGRWVRALDLYLLATRLRSKGASEAAQLEAQREAEKERTELLAVVPRLSIEVEGGSLQDVEVTIDGRAVDRSQLGGVEFVDPGNHLIVARRGAEVVKAHLSISQRETKTAVLSLGSLPESVTDHDAAPRDVFASPKTNLEGSERRMRVTDHGATQRTFGWVGLGVGGAGLLTGAGLGAWLLLERPRLEDAGCAGSSCYDDQGKDVDRYNAVRTASLVGFVAGTAFAAVGAALLFTASPEGSPATTAVVVGPGFASIRGNY